MMKMKMKKYMFGFCVLGIFAAAGFALTNAANTFTASQTLEGEITINTSNPNS